MVSYKDVAAQGKAEYDASRTPPNPDNPSSTTDKNATVIQGMMQAQIDSGKLGRIDVSKNVQLVWSPEQSAYVTKVRSSASGSWKVQMNADGRPVMYTDPSLYK